MRLTVFSLAPLAILLTACGGGVLLTSTGEPPPTEEIGDGKSTLTTFYAGVALDGSQCLPQAPDRMCRVLVVNTRCVGEEGLREADASDQEGVSALREIPAGSRVCELAQLSPGLCRSKSSPAWCYVAGGCDPGAATTCTHALCPGAGMGPTLAALGPAYLACDRSQ